MSNSVLPNFFVVGAPKSGSTSLDHYLNQHPQIYMSPIKEPLLDMTPGIGFSVRSLCQAGPVLSMAPRVVPLISFPGREIQPTFSPEATSWPSGASRGLPLKVGGA
jgi:hypothetical protein